MSVLADTEARLQALQKNRVVDRVEGRRQVQKDQGGRVTTVDSLEDVRQHPQNSGFIRMARSKTRLQQWQEINGRQVFHQLADDEALQELLQYRQVGDRSV